MAVRLSFHAGISLFGLLVAGLLQAAYAATECVPLVGYTATADIDHFGDDINCEPIGPDTVPGRCTSNPDCRAFNVYSVNGVGWSCTKRVVGPINTPTAGLCYYTKAALDCPPVPGYTVTPGIDHYGDDISCEPMGREQVVARCSSNPDCRAFNVYSTNGVGWGCTKRVAGPADTPTAGLCFYTKNDPGPSTCTSTAPGGHRVLLARNHCAQTVWLGVLANAGTSPYAHQTAFRLHPGACTALPLPAGWAGRFWGKTGCSPDGRICQSGSNPPYTLAEVTLDGFGGQDFYDISLVDGFNVPMTFTPLDASGAPVAATAAAGGGGGSFRCATAGCSSNLLVTCPPELQVRAGGALVACASACTRFNTDAYCCRGAFGCGPQCCPPTSYSRIFKAACPLAYSYAYDDQTSTFTCPVATASGGYRLDFCL